MTRTALCLIICAITILPGCGEKKPAAEKPKKAVPTTTAVDIETWIRIGEFGEVRAFIANPENAMEPFSNLMSGIASSCANRSIDLTNARDIGDIRADDANWHPR